MISAGEGGGSALALASASAPASASRSSVDTSSTGGSLDLLNPFVSQFRIVALDDIEETDEGGSLWAGRWGGGGARGGDDSGDWGDGGDGGGESKGGGKATNHGIGGQPSLLPVDSLCQKVMGEAALAVVGGTVPWAAVTVWVSPDAPLLRMQRGKQGRGEGTRGERRRAVEVVGASGRLSDILPSSETVSGRSISMLLFPSAEGDRHDRGEDGDEEGSEGAMSMETSDGSGEAAARGLDVWLLHR